jgi:predicted Zn-dependent protease
LWVGRLVKIEPAALTTLELRAAVQFALGHHDDVLKIIGDSLQGIGDASELEARQRWAAQQLDGFALRLRQAGQTEWLVKYAQQAELNYRELVKTSARHQMLLVGYHARQGELDEALRLLEEHWSDSDTEQITVAVATIQANSLSSPTHQKRLTDLVMKVVDGGKKNTTLLLALAELAMWRGDNDEAIARYRGILQDAPKNALALNNLAILLAVVKREHAEAQSLLGQLVQAMGDSPVLLDSRAMIFLAAGRPGKALDDLKKAVDEDAPTRDNQFHMAQAMLQLGNADEARSRFHAALEMGLAEDRLQPFERDAFRRLRRDLGSANQNRSPQALK